MQRLDCEREHVPASPRCHQLSRSPLGVPGRYFHHRLQLPGREHQLETVNLPLLFSHHLHHSYFTPVISLKGVCLLITISFLRQQTKILETTEGRRDESYRRDHVIGQYHHSLLLIVNSLIFQILRLTALAGGQGHQLLFLVLFFPQWSQLQPPITFPLAFTVNRNHINRVDYDAVMKFEYKPI